MTEYAKRYVISKCVISGHKLEFQEYSVPVLSEPRSYCIERIKSDDSVKRTDNLYRARKAVRQRVWSNVTPHSKFLTLTTADTVLDVKIFCRRLTTFFQSMKRAGYDLRYLYVLERQKERGIKEGNEGSVHAHIIIFNDEFIPFDIINKHWKGTTDIHMLNGLRWENGEKVRDAGAYICKYVTKEANIEWGSHCFRCSKGLNKPIEFPAYAYGCDDIMVPDDEGMYNQQFYNLMQLANITYQNAIVVRYNAGDGIINQIIDYKQGTIDMG